MLEKTHRLPADVYKGEVVVSITCCIKDRVRFFTSGAIFKKFEEHLLNELAVCHCSAEAYLFMPDHCHLLLKGDQESSDVLKAVKRFKQQTGYWLSRNHPNVRWQKDFYDHIIADEDEFEKHIRYVLENPVRMGLVEDWRKYAFKGSTTMNLDEWTGW